MATQDELLDQDKLYQATVGSALLASQIVRTETDASGYDFVLGENNLVSNSANKLPTQRSVKQYIDHPATNVGTVATGSTVVEWGDFYQHTAVITVNTTLGAIAGGAALGLGKLIYTLPAGAVIVDAAYMSIAITQTQGHINADTPEVGLGTVVASGAVAILDTPSTFENLLTGQVAANCTGTATVKTVADQVFVIESAAAHSVYINVAATWAASGDAAALLTGTVVLKYKFMH
jgi:hypothetical protein